MVFVHCQASLNSHVLGVSSWEAAVKAQNQALSYNSVSRIVLFA